MVVQENGKLLIENEPKTFTSLQNVQIVMVCTFLYYLVPKVAVVYSKFQISRIGHCFLS